MIPHSVAQELLPVLSVQPADAECVFAVRGYRVVG